MKFVIAFFIILLCFPAYALEDGTLLFLENSNRAVESFTGGNFTHVAIVLSDEDGKEWVYNAEPPKVKKYLLEDYLEEIGIMNDVANRTVLVTIMEPQSPYTNEEKFAMQTFLESQIGTIYSVKSYVLNKRCQGIHCSQMCSAAISGRISFSLPFYRISPARLKSCLGSFYVQHGKRFLVKLKDRSVSSRWKSWLRMNGTMWSWSCFETLKLVW